MCRHFTQKHRAKIQELLFTEPRYSRQFLVRAWTPGGHLSERNVGKNDVRRQAPFVSQFLAQSGETAQQHLVTRDLPRSRVLARDLRRLRKLDWLALLQNCEAFVGKTNCRETALDLLHMAQAN